MPQKFSVDIERRGLQYTGTLQPPPAGVDLMPATWSDTATWGYDRATVRATGPAERLGELLMWVGSRVSIRNEMGTVVWFGYIHEVEANFGGSTIGTSLDDVYNRICVAYTTRRPDGSQERRTTDWVEDAGSIAQYGTREVRLGADDVSDDNALLLRARALAQRAWPAPKLRTSGVGGQPAATLHCRGYAALLDRLYYDNPNGLAEHTTAAKGEQALYAYKTGTTISFGTYADPAGGSDDIKDSANGFGGLLVGDEIYVTGATNGANNGTFALVSASATNLETVTKDRVDEAAGATVTVAAYTAATTDLAQTFKLPTGATAWKCKKISVRAYVRGTPTGNLGISLHAEEGLGYPGTELDYGQIALSSLSERMSWVEVSMVGGQVFLQPDTWYWINVTTSNPQSIASHVVIGLDETFSLTVGDGRINYLVDGWQIRDPHFDLPFRVTGAVDSMDLVEECIALSPDVATVEAQVVGVGAWQYRDGERTALDEADDLLALGSTDGERLLVRWRRAPEGVQLAGVTIEEPPTSDDANPVLDRNGRLRQATGAPWESGILAAGRWVDLEFLPALDGVAMQARGQALFVERSQYDAMTDTISLESQGVSDPMMGIGRGPG